MTLGNHVLHYAVEPLHYANTLHRNTTPCSVWPAFCRNGRILPYLNLMFSQTQLACQWTCHLVQVYIQEMAACVLQTGQVVDSRAGLRLQRLFMEFCCLYCVKARVDPREWRSMLKNAVSPEDSGPAAASQATDYAMITVCASATCSALHHTTLLETVFE